LRTNSVPFGTEREKKVDAENNLAETGEEA